jgi:hypothetical protein
MDPSAARSPHFTDDERTSFGRPFAGYKYLPIELSLATLDTSALGRVAGLCTSSAIHREVREELSVVVVAKSLTE